MNITTRAQDFEMSKSVDQFARDQVRAALQHFSESVVAADVFMKDINGPKGGIDKQVLIRVQLHNRQTIALEAEHQDLYGAIKVGARRTKRAVRRHLQKSRRIDKQRMRDQLQDSGVPAAI
jgi:ribosome-associated translation inhibitor RaiA